MVGRLIWGLNQLKLGKNSALPKVSVIVAARNEEQHLPDCLAALISQDYPAELLEIIIIDDRSTDRTGQIITQYASQYKIIKPVAINVHQVSASPKKKALACGIFKATGEILIFTDADCIPPPTWVAEIVKYFDPDVSLVIGFSPLVSPRKTIWSGIIWLDSLAAAAVAAAGIGLGTAITGNGRNLAYTKKIYQEVNGFRAIESVLSGDDDLFLHQVRTKIPTRIRYCFSPGAIVPARQIHELRAFLKQRRRHLSAGAKYPFKIKVGYLLFHSTNLIIFSLFFISLFTNKYLIFGCVGLICKFCIDWAFLQKFSRRMNYASPLKYFFWWECFFVLFNSIIGPTAFVGKIQWK